jgi:hypothetical protein
MPTAVKFRYYLLPALPAVALLAGPELARLWRGGRAARGGLAVVVGVAAFILAIRRPAGDLAESRANTLRPFARAAAERYPAPAPLAFYGPVRTPVVVYLGRHAESLKSRRERLVPGLGVIALEPAYRELAAAGLVGEPIVTAVGRIGNRERGRIVLAEAR